VINDAGIHIWCAASNALAQGIVGALVVALIGLLAWPTEAVPPQPSLGRQAPWMRARRAVLIGRWLLPAAIATVIATLGLYLVVYAKVGGKGCDASLTSLDALLVVLMTSVAFASVLLVLVLAHFRRLVRDFSKTRTEA
jgi:hypothetical protein